MKRLRLRQAALGGGNTDAYAEYLLQEIRRNPELAKDILTPNKKTFNAQFYDMFEVDNKIDPSIPRDSEAYFKARLDYANQQLEVARKAWGGKNVQVI